MNRKTARTNSSTLSILRKKLLQFNRERIYSQSGPLPDRKRSVLLLWASTWVGLYHPSQRKQKVHWRIQERWW